MSEEQKEYDLGIEKKEFNSLGEAVRYFRQSNDNLTISSVTQFMGWTHSQLMDIELGRKILTDMDIVKQLAEALEIDSSILLDLMEVVELSYKPFNPSNFGTPDGSFNGTIYRSFDGKFTFKESNGIWVILASNGAKIPLVVFRGQIESDDFAEKLFKSFEVKE